MAAISASTLAAIAAASSVASAGMSIVGGMQQQKEAQKQANLAMGTAQAQAKEQVRVSAMQASAEKERADDVARSQKLAYLKSGVSLEGSPLLMIEATRLQGQKNVDEIIASGGAASASSMLEGRTAAQNYQSSGRQAMMSGITNAVGSLGSAANYSKGI